MGKIKNDFAKAGIQLKTYILDNESSEHLKSAIALKEISYQSFPSHRYRANPAERAIQIFKNHFKVYLASLDPDFPLSEWNRIIY